MTLLVEKEGKTWEDCQITGSAISENRYKEEAEIKNKGCLYRQPLSKTFKIVKPITFSRLFQPVRLRT